VLDLGVLRTESDEDQFVASDAFARRKSDVVTGVATVLFFFHREQIIGKLLVLFHRGVSLLASGILELLIHFDKLQVLAQSDSLPILIGTVTPPSPSNSVVVDDAVVGSRLLHVLELLDTVIHDGDA